jgi:hypothetical protein
LDDDDAVGPQGPLSPEFRGPDVDDGSTVPSDDRFGDDEVVDGYIEGQEAADPYPVERSRSTLAAVLAWVLPILGGSAIGILVAIQIFGLPT